MLGRRDFDNSNRWDQTTIAPSLHQTATKFIEFAKKNSMHITTPFSNVRHAHALSSQQQLALHTIISHNRDHCSTPLYMTIRGTTGTRKSYLISCIRSAQNENAQQRSSQLLTLAPTGVATFNIHATTIHFALCIPIK